MVVATRKRTEEKSRVCQCGAKLSQYNDGDSCAACSEKQRDIRDLFADLMWEELQSGKETTDAAGVVRDKLRKDGRLDEFRESFEIRMMSALWVGMAHVFRLRAGEGTEAQGAVAPVRRQDYGRLTSDLAEIYATPYRVKNGWKPLGDMTRDDWLWVAQKQGALADANRRGQEIALAFAERIKGKKTTREAIGPDEVRKMLDKTTKEAA